MIPTTFIIFLACPGEFREFRLLAQTPYPLRKGDCVVITEEIPGLNNSKIKAVAYNIQTQRPEVFLSRARFDSSAELAECQAILEAAHWTEIN